MFRRNKKNTNKYHNYIIVSEKDTSTFHFSHHKLLNLIGITIVIVSVALFFSADAITGFFYKAKIKDIQADYEYLTETLVNLNTQLEDVSDQVVKIEAKDKAIRTYSGLPQIDQDIRQLGVGGTNFSEI